MKLKLQLLAIPARAVFHLLLLLAATYRAPAQTTYEPYIFTTIAGSAGKIGSLDGVGEDAQFAFPYGLTFDLDGNLYIADYENHTLRKMTPTNDVTTFAGSPSGAGGTDGPISSALFRGPNGVARDASGNFYVADYSTHTIRKVGKAGTVSTLAGLDRISGKVDGVGGDARFNEPSDVQVDVAGNLYVADSSNHTIRKITSSGTVSTFAGSLGVQGSADGFGGNARFRSLVATPSTLQAICSSLTPSTAPSAK